MDTASLSNTVSTGTSSSFSTNFAAIIGGNHTEFVLNQFTNQTNIIVTQFGKIGNLYQVKIDQPENGLNICEPVYTISTVLGGENLEAEVAVRYLAEKLQIKRTFLLCLSLKEFSKSTVNAIGNVIEERMKR